MQTFLPYADFTKVASVLDNQRLNKQALEGWQIMMTNLALDPEGNRREPKGWRNHPAVKMWRGHEMALFMYIQAMVEEWKSRGYKSTIGTKAWSTIQVAISKGLINSGELDAPQWIENQQLFEQIASSHRTALLNKDYEWYSQFGWAEDTGTKPETYDYIWPIN